RTAACRNALPEWQAAGAPRRARRRALPPPAGCCRGAQRRRKREVRSMEESVKTWPSISPFKGSLGEVLLEKRKRKLSHLRHRIAQKCRFQHSCWRISEARLVVFYLLALHKSLGKHHIGHMEDACFPCNDGCFLIHNSNRKR